MESDHTVLLKWPGGGARCGAGSAQVPRALAVQARAPFDGLLAPQVASGNVAPCTPAVRDTPGRPPDSYFPVRPLSSPWHFGGALPAGGWGAAKASASRRGAAGLALAVLCRPGAASLGSGQRRRQELGVGSAGLEPLKIRFVSRWVVGSYFQHVLFLFFVFFK